MEQFTKEELELVAEALGRAARRQYSESREKGISTLSVERHVTKADAFSKLSLKARELHRGI